MWTYCNQSKPVMFQPQCKQRTFPTSVYFQSRLSVHIRMLWFSYYCFLLLGWFSVVRQHYWGKQCRLITLDSHKLNPNGLWFHIKVPDGCEWWQETRAWFACHSVTFALFTFPINTDRHIYQTTGEDGNEKEKKKAILESGTSEKMWTVDKKVIDNESQNGETEREDYQQCWAVWQQIYIQWWAWFSRLGLQWGHT